MDVQLRVNMIMPGGRFVPYGTIIDKEEIPPDIRKERYYDVPGKVEPLYVSDEEQQEQDVSSSSPVARPSSLRRGANM